MNKFDLQNNQTKENGANLQSIEHLKSVGTFPGKEAFKLKNSNKTKGILIAVFSLVLLGASIISLVFVKKPKPTALKNNTIITQPVATLEVKVGGVPKSLIEHSSGMSSMGIGYIKAKQIASKGNILFKKVFAEEVPTYHPAIFYFDTVDGNKQAFSYDVTSKVSEQLTTGSDNPNTLTFSSITQRLVYASACDIMTVDLNTRTKITIANGVNNPGDGINDPSAYCYRPETISSDGNSLVFIATRTVNSTDTGLVGYSHVAIYDFTTKKTKDLTIPDGFNSSSNVVWSNDGNLIIKYAKFGKYGSLDKSQIFIHDTTSDKTVNYDGPDEVINGVTVVGDMAYALNSTTNDVEVANIKQNKPFVKVLGSEGVMSFLVKLDDSGQNAIELIGTSGQFCSPDIFSLPAIGGEMKKLYNFTRCGGGVLGWGQSYDEFFYVSNYNNKNEISLFNLKDHTSTVIKTDLPML
ncbi:MAG: hypothetical protein WCF91_03585 [bacterium]